MNSESIWRLPFGCRQWLRGASAASAMLLAAVFPVSAADSSATNKTVEIRATPPAGWKLIAEGGADAELLNDPGAAAPENTNAHPMRLTIRQRGSNVGLIETAARQTDLAAGQWYDLVFQAMTQNGKHFALTVSLESDDGNVCARTTLPEVGGSEWKKYAVALHARLPAKKARVVITLAEPGTVWFDDLALVLRKETKAEKP
jgi:hypothetical protein